MFFIVTGQEVNGPLVPRLRRHLQKLRHSTGRFHGRKPVLWLAATCKERVVPGAPRFVRQPLVILIGHVGDCLHLRLRHGKEEAVALLRDPVLLR